MSDRQYKQRSAEEVREAAAKLCERMARHAMVDGPIYMNDHQGLDEAAKRIRRIPLAGMFKVTK